MWKTIRYGSPLFMFLTMSYCMNLYDVKEHDQAYWPKLHAQKSHKRVNSVLLNSEVEWIRELVNLFTQRMLPGGELSNFTIELVVDLIWFDSSMSRKFIFLNLPLMLVSNNLQCAFISSAQNSWSLGISAQQDSNDPSSCLGFMLK